VPVAVYRAPVSVVVLTSQWLGTGPTAWVEDGQLHARASLLFRALSAFSHDVRLRVDRKSRYVTIERRWWWGLRRRLRAVPFRQISHVAYRFSSFGTEWAWFHRTDQFEVLSVSLALAGGETVPLFSFLGEGSVVTGWRGELLGDSPIDLRGDQVEHSRRFVDLLAAALGVGLRAPVRRVRRDAYGNVWRCGDCHVLGPPRPGRCFHCGGELASRRDP